MRSLFRLALLLVGVAGGGCDEGPPPAPKYFERVIQPILTTNCVFNQGACHKDDGHGNALGNLDLSSYAAIKRRPDVLKSYGSYPLPLLLLKASGAAVPPIPYQGASSGPLFLPSEIQHAGGATINVESTAFFELQRWLSSGASEDGSVLERPKKSGTGNCRSDFATVRPDVAAELGTVDANSAAFKDFAADVEPLLTTSCAFGTCHSAEQSDFFLTCKGSGSDEASKFNFLEAQAFIGSPPETSLLLLKPLAPSSGGRVHTGGVFFSTQMDVSWKKLLAWVTEAGVSSQLQNLPEGQRFFNDHVMPIFLKRGCALESCHSPGAANDFKLRAGTSGFFSAFSLASNYRVARQDFLVPDVPDVRQSRLVKKPVRSPLEGGFGIVHRGGPPLESPGDPNDLSKCPQPWSDTSSPLCTIAEWHRIERAALLADGKADSMAAGSSLQLVVVVRPPDGDRLIDFDSYRPGADLVIGTVNVGPLGAIDPSSAAATGSLLDHCAGVQPNRSNVDVRGPDVSYDTSKVVFAMRLSAGDTLDLYEVTLDAAHTCTKITDGNGRSEKGLPLHNLDPMYAPDGSVVFASTRGRPAMGPTRSLKYLLPQTDLWRLVRNGSSYGAPEQMTALLGSELSPAMMQNGQVTFTTEKATADFYQLSGRRINWDLTDYHPLFAQRAQSPGLDGMLHPSVDYRQATEIREGVDRNFVFILSDDGAKGAAKGAGGALAIFNRSIGPFESDRSDVQFLKSLSLVDPAVSGHAGATVGAYRSPFPLPDGRILVSYAPDVTDLTTATAVRYDLVVVDATTGARTPVTGFTGSGKSYVEPLLVYKREPRPLFQNLTQLVFGGRVDPSDMQHGDLHFPDLPLLGTLLGANLRSGRFVDMLRPATQVVLYESLPPPEDLASAMAGLTGTERVYDARKEIGRGDLAADGSVHLRLPAMTPILLALQDGSGRTLFSMTEEDQLGPGEHISRGVPEKFFNSVCGGCHGSISGRELDIAIDADALTGASVSLSRDPSRTIPIGR